MVLLVPVTKETIVVLVEELNRIELQMHILRSMMHTMVSMLATCIVVTGCTNLAVPRHGQNVD